MVDQEVARIARDRVQIEIAEQTARIKGEIERIKSEMSARGGFRSGWTLKRITDICADAVKSRVQLSVANILPVPDNIWYFVLRYPS